MVKKLPVVFNGKISTTKRIKNGTKIGFSLKGKIEKCSDFNDLNNVKKKIDKTIIKPKMPNSVAISR